jgi:CRISPR-associated protein Csy1
MRSGEPALPTAPVGEPAPDAENAPARSADDWALTGQRELRSGNLGQAIVSFTRATELEPAGALHWARLGRVLAVTQQHDAAEAALRRACALDPRQPALYLALAELCAQQNRMEEAIEACLHALAADPDSVHAAVAEALMLPPIYSSTTDLAQWRKRFSEGLERLHAAKPHWLARPRGVFSVETTNFYLPYQGGDDRVLQSGYSDFLAALLGAAAPDLQAPITRQRNREAKIRIGFMSSNLRACTIGDYFESWITDLPRERFEVCALLTESVPDARTRAFASASDEFAALSGTVEEVARAVKSRRLDVLVFPDVGMAVWSSLFAAMRLAPVQCAAWGHPVTTGSEFIDYFLSCADMEPPGTASYREPLTLLPGLGTRYRPPPHAEPARRESFGLPPDGRIYLCPHSLYKIHPETDPLFFELLARDPQAVLVFFAATTAGQRQAFVDRLQRGMQARGLPPRQQIKLLPYLSRSDFRSVMTVCDVMLDPLHWSGGGTSLDALTTGLPLVTLPGQLMRGRQSAAMLRTIGVEELVARDEQEYIAIALRVAQDRAYREALRARIRDGLPRLIDRSEPVEALAAAFERMVNADEPHNPYLPKSTSG